MDIRCGIDMIELERFQRALNSGEGFKKRVFTESETAYCGASGKAALQSLAARFCAKEAVAKALGTGIAKGISFQDIEVFNEEGGKPKVILHGAAKDIYEEMKAIAIDISLTHSRDYAAAQAVILIGG